MNALLVNWDRVTHICVGKLTIIGSDNGLSHGRCQAIIWTNAGILLTGPLGTNVSDQNLYIFIQENAFKNVVWKMAATLSHPQCVNCAYAKNIKQVTWCVMPPTGCMYQVSSSYLKTCRKKSENFSLVESSAEIPLPSVCGHQRAKNCPTMMKISMVQDTCYTSVCTESECSIYFLRP